MIFIIHTAYIHRRTPHNHTQQTHAHAAHAHLQLDNERVARHGKHGLLVLNVLELLQTHDLLLAQHLHAVVAPRGFVHTQTHLAERAGALKRTNKRKMSE